MKIVNATNKLLIKSEISLPLLKKNGGNQQVTLNPGEFVYVEEIGNNSMLRFYERKKMIEVLEEEKPSNLNFYVVYNYFDLLKEVSENIANAHEKLRNEVINDERFPKALREEFSKIEDKINSEEEEIVVEVIVPDNSLKEDSNQNKGGRPKGSKNKSTKKKGKAGRPKKKTKKATSKSKK
jgi:uncharacterized protein (UPF0147 family)